MKRWHSSEPGETEEVIDAEKYFHGHRSQHSSLGPSQNAASNSMTETCWKYAQILNAHGLDIIPFDSLPSNFIHFLIAYISTNV